MGLQPSIPMLRGVNTVHSRTKWLDFPRRKILLHGLHPFLQMLDKLVPSQAMGVWERSTVPVLRVSIQSQTEIYVEEPHEAASTLMGGTSAPPAVAPTNTRKLGTHTRDTSAGRRLNSSALSVLTEPNRSRT